MFKLIHKYTRTCSFIKYIFHYQELLNFTDVRIFCKKSSFFGKNSTFGQSYTENTKYYMPGVIQFAAMTKSVIFFDVVVFLLSNLVVGSGFMSISLLVLEL